MANRFAHLIPSQTQQAAPAAPAQRPGNRFAHLIPKKTTGQPQTVDRSGKGDMGLGAGEVAPSTYAADAGRSLLSGLRTGVETLAGTVGDAQQFSGDIAAKIAEKVGVSPEIARKVGGFIAVPGVAPMPTTEQIQGVTKRVAGDPYQPQTRVGRYANTLGEFAPNAVAGPEGIGRKVAMTVVPALASEAAGQAAEGSPYEPVVRAGTAIATTLATGGRGKASKQIQKFTQPQEVVKKQTDAAFRELRQAGISYDDKQYRRVLGALANKLQADGVVAEDAPRSMGQIKRLAGLVGNKVEWPELESIRRGLGEIMSEGPAVSNTDKRVAGVVRDHIDALMRSGKAKTTGLISPKEANAKMKAARELGQRTILARDLDEMARRAENYTSGQESGMKLQIKSYLNSKKGRMLAKTSPEVYQALQEARGGSLTRNALATLGRAGVDLSPTGAIAFMLPALAGGATYAGTGGDWEKTALAVAGATAARAGSKYLHGRDFKRAKDVVLAGRKVQQSVGGAVKARNAATLRTAAVSGNQSRAGANPAPWPEGAVLQDAQGRFYGRDGRLLPAQ